MGRRHGLLTTDEKIQQSRANKDERQTAGWNKVAQDKEAPFALSLGKSKLRISTEPLALNRLSRAGALQRGSRRHQRDDMKIAAYSICQ